MVRATMNGINLSDDHPAISIGYANSRSTQVSYILDSINIYLAISGDRSEPY